MQQPAYADISAEQGLLRIHCDAELQISFTNQLQIRFY